MLRPLRGHSPCRKPQALSDISSGKNRRDNIRVGCKGKPNRMGTNQQSQRPEALSYQTQGQKYSLISLCIAVPPLPCARRILSTEPSTKSKVSRIVGSGISPPEADSVIRMALGVKKYHPASEGSPADYHFMTSVFVIGGAAFLPGLPCTLRQGFSGVHYACKQRAFVRCFHAFKDFSRMSNPFGSLRPRDK